MNPPTILRDKKLQERMDVNGFVRISLLRKSDIDDLLGIYQAHAAEILSGGTLCAGVGFNWHHRDRSYVARLHEQVKPIVARAMRRHFDDFKWMGSSLVVKEPNPSSIVAPHHHWTNVEEHQHRSLTIWIPLIDVDVDNGALGVIHGSHRFFTSPRASLCAHPIYHHTDVLFRHLDVRPMAAGEALVMDDATIHGSPPNFSHDHRVAVTAFVTHRDAQCVHHYPLPHVQPPQVEMYAVDEQFFIDYPTPVLQRLHNEGGKPAGVRPISTLPLDIPDISEGHLLTLLRSHPANKPDPALTRIAKQVWHRAAQNDAPGEPPKVFRRKLPLREILDRLSGEVRRLWGG